MSEVKLDIALDRTEGEQALIIEGLRLPLTNPNEESFELLEEIFYMLVNMKMEIRAHRDWQKNVMAHLRRVPMLPDWEV